MQPRRVKHTFTAEYQLNDWRTVLRHRESTPNCYSGLETKSTKPYCRVERQTNVVKMSSYEPRTLPAFSPARRQRSRRLRITPMCTALERYIGTGFPKSSRKLEDSLKSIASGSALSCSARSRSFQLLLSFPFSLLGLKIAMRVDPRQKLALTFSSRIFTRKSVKKKKIIGCYSLTAVLILPLPVAMKQEKNRALGRSNEAYEVPLLPSGSARPVVLSSQPVSNVAAEKQEHESR